MPPPVLQNGQVVPAPIDEHQFLSVSVNKFILILIAFLFVGTMLYSMFKLHRGAEGTRHYEKKHFQSLALALGLGLLGTLFGGFLKIQIPFIVLMVCITFLLFALDRVLGYIKNTGKPYWRSTGLTCTRSGEGGDGEDASAMKLYLL